MNVKIAKQVEKLKGQTSQRVFLGKNMSDNTLPRRTSTYYLFTDGLETLSLGQGLELHWRFRGICPSINDYLSMIDHKTGGFFRIVAELMFVEAEASNSEADADANSNADLFDLTTLLGRYYQIRDDYKNLVSDDPSIPFKYALCARLTRYFFHRSTLPPKASATTSVKANSPFRSSTSSRTPPLPPPISSGTSCATAQAPRALTAHSCQTR